MSLSRSRINEARGRGMPELRQMQQRSVAPDGNCLFRAASVALARDMDMRESAEEQSARKLRRDVVEFMRANHASFASFMPEGQSFEEYLQTMSRDGVWGGELEVSAIAPASAGARVHQGRDQVCAAEHVSRREQGLRGQDQPPVSREALRRAV
jgi:hypothetical protein